jgi:hypothetical protein
MAIAYKPRDERSEFRGSTAGLTSFIPRLAPSTTRHVVVLLGVSAALFLPFLGSRELSSSHEARAAINATVVLERGAWGLPRLFDEQIELQKPPLYYWLVSVLGLWRGQVDAWAVRLPAALAGIGCVLCVYWFLTRQGRRAAGLLAALMLATMVHFTWLAQVGRVDMVLTLLVTLTLCCGVGFQPARPLLLPSPPARADSAPGCIVWAGGERPGVRGDSADAGNVCPAPAWDAPPHPQPLSPARPVTEAFEPLQGGGEGGKAAENTTKMPECRQVGNLPHAVAGLALGLGVLCKGPIALALAGAVALTWLVLIRQRPSPRWLWGLLIVAAVSMPWFVWANHETGGRLFDVFFWHHNVERGFGSETLEAQPWWFYGMRFWVDLAPWSLVAPLAVVWAWRRRLLHDDPVCRFALAWFGSMFVLLSCAGFKRADYLLPAYPGLALFLGAVGADWLSAQSQRVRRAATSAGVVVALLAIAGWSTFHVVADEGWPYREAAARIRDEAGPETPVIFFRAECHPLAFHLGRPMTTVLEWENAEIWAGKSRPIWFVMPAACADEWDSHVSVPLEPVFALDELPQAVGVRALIVLRNRAGDP